MFPQIWAAWPYMYMVSVSLVRCKNGALKTNCTSQRSLTASKKWVTIEIKVTVIYQTHFPSKTAVSEHTISPTVYLMVIFSHRYLGSDRILEKKIIKERTSPYASPIVFGLKGWRLLCINYMYCKLNEKLEKMQIPSQESTSPWMLSIALDGSRPLIPFQDIIR